jgi:viroplasmin and RNaseH domain-containing protein
MGKGAKFYAVRKGHSTGIFPDWPSCEAAVKGFKGAEFKSFATQAEADAYLAGRAAAPAPAAAAAARQQQRGGLATGNGSKWFAVVCGRLTGVFSGSWDDVKGHVLG